MCSYVYEYDIIIECEFDLQKQKIEGGTLQKTHISIFANSFHFWMFWKQNLNYSSILTIDRGLV